MKIHMLTDFFYLCLRKNITPIRMKTTLARGMMTIPMLVCARQTVELPKQLEHITALSGDWNKTGIEKNGLKLLT